MRCPDNYQTPCLESPAPAANSYALQVCGQGIYTTRFNQRFPNVTVCFGANPVLPPDSKGRSFSANDQREILAYLRKRMLGILRSESLLEVPSLGTDQFASCVLQNTSSTNDETVTYNSATTYLATSAGENLTAAAEDMFCGCVTPFTWFPNLAADAQTQNYIDGLSCKAESSNNLANVLVPSLLLTSLFCLLLGFVFGKYWERKNSKSEEKQPFVEMRHAGYGLDLSAGTS